MGWEERRVASSLVGPWAQRAKKLAGTEEAEGAKERARRRRRATDILKEEEEEGKEEEEEEKKKKKEKKVVCYGGCRLKLVEGW